MTLPYSSPAVLYTLPLPGYATSLALSPDTDYLAIITMTTTSVPDSLLIVDSSNDDPTMWSIHAHAIVDRRLGRSKRNGDITRCRNQ